MKSTAFALFALLSLLGAASGGVLVQAEVVEPSIPLDVAVQSSQMGRSLLVEEVTLVRGLTLNVGLLVLQVKCQIHKKDRHVNKKEEPRKMILNQVKDKNL